MQPFWILPALSKLKPKLKLNLKLKDVMGYTVIVMFWVGLIYIVAMLASGARI